MNKEKRTMWAIVSSSGFANRIIYHKTFRAISEEEAQKIFERGTYSRDFSDLGVNFAEARNTIVRIYFFETKKERDECYNGIPSENKIMLEGMFDAEEIDNDLAAVDDAIRAYWELAPRTAPKAKKQEKEAQDNGKQTANLRTRKRRN